MPFDAKSDTRATAIDPADVLPFGDVSADGWDTITLTSFFGALNLGAGDTYRFGRTVDPSKTPATITGVLAYLDSEMAPGPPANGDPISTVTDAVGGHVFSGSGGGRPTYDTTNTADGRPTWNCTSGTAFDADAAILDLTADWCAHAVIAFTAVGNDSLVFGLNNNGLSSNYQGLTVWAYSGNAYRVVVNAAGDTNLYSRDNPRVGEWHILRVRRRAGNLELFVNGRKLKLPPGTASVPSPNPTLNGGAVFRLGNALSNLGFGTSFRFAALVLGSNLCGDTQQQQVEDYLGQRYGIPVNRALTLDPQAGGTSLMATAVITDNPSTTSPLLVGNTSVTPDDPAALSVYGNFAARARGGGHALVNEWNSGKNTVWVQNLAPGGYSAVMFADHTGSEHGAIGYGNSGSGSVYTGFTFLDALNAPIRVVTNATIGGTNGSWPRLEFDLSGNTKIYRPSGAGTTVDFQTDLHGNVALGGGSIATAATDGFLYLPTCAGTPTGTPTAYAGRVPIVFDTTAHKLWIYDSGSWRGVVLS